MMEIPGLDEIMVNMKKFDEVLPVLKSIDNNLRVLTEITIESTFNSTSIKNDYHERLK